LQLDQLQRDAELYRAKLAEQEEPVNTSLGIASAGSVGTPTSSVTAPAVAQVAELNALIASLRSRLDAPGTRATATNVTSSPADLFRDRNAYRDMLKAARNAASLDETHDLGDRSLIRLSFQATVLPNPKYDRSLAALSVQVIPKPITSDDIKQIYFNWLSYLSSELSEANQTALPGSLVYKNAFFSTVYLETGKEETCRGWFAELAPTANKGCKLLAFASPNFLDAGPDNAKEYDAVQMLNAFKDLPGPDKLENLISLLAEGDQADKIGAPYCVGDPSKLKEELSDAVSRSLNGLTLFGYLDDEVSNLPNGSNLRSEINDTPAIKTLLKKRAAMLNFLSSLDSVVSNPLTSGSCEQLNRYLKKSERPDNRVFTPAKFEDTLRKVAGREVRVYEVSPREQVQQVSTLARAASAVQLGASLAAAKPGSGMAANASTAFGRQAIGRAETLERLPAVVGYAGSGGADFGWAIGPKATVDPKGKIKLQHGVEPIDLSVDMSVPAFTTTLQLQVERQWGPDAATLVRPRTPNGEISGTAINGMTVTLRPQRGDLQRLTMRLLQPRLADDYALRTNGKAVGPAISACRPTTLWIEGPNVYRTTSSLVHGRYLDNKAIVIGPGMDGIFLTVPALVPSEDDPVNETDVKVRLFSAFGPPAVLEHPYSRTKVGEQCKPKKDTSADPTATGLSQNTVTVPSQLTIRVTGTNLKQVDRVTIGGVAAKIDGADEKGTWVNVSLAKELTEQLAANPDAQIELFVNAVSKAKIKLSIIKSK
jgi:hypothetical protein